MELADRFLQPGGDPDPYGAYTDLVFKWEARIEEGFPAIGNMSIRIKLTMDDMSLNVTAQGTTTFNGGYTLADDVTDNSAVFSVSTKFPTLVVAEGFNTANDT